MLKIAFATSLIVLVSLALAPFQILAIRTGIFDPRRIPRLWHGLAARLLGFRVTLYGAMAADRPLMIVSNHVSWTDIVLLGSIADVSFIAKSEMARWPGFGTLARLHRSIFVDREDRRGSGDQARAVADRIAGGDAIVLFAEGTTSDGTRLLPFKSTLFGAVPLVLADPARATVQVQPVAIVYRRFHGVPMGRVDRDRAAWTGDEDLLPHIGWLIRRGAHDVDIVFGEPIVVEGRVDRKALARRCEEAVRAMIASRR